MDYLTLFYLLIHGGPLSFIVLLAIAMAICPAVIALIRRHHTAWAICALTFIAMWVPNPFCWIPYAIGLVWSVIKWN